VIVAEKLVGAVNKMNFQRFTPGLTIKSVRL
jgi:hypothetical protein